MIEASISAAFAVVGLLIYVMAGKPETKRVGEIMFACGLLTALLFVGPAIVGLGRGLAR
jgi:hypothetical protein